MIEKKGDDIFQSESLEAVEDNIREKLFLIESGYISINALNDLVNPELKPQAQPWQLLWADSPAHLGKFQEGGPLTNLPIKALYLTRSRPFLDSVSPRF